MIRFAGIAEKSSNTPLWVRDFGPVARKKKEGAIRCMCIWGAKHDMVPFSTSLNRHVLSILDKCSDLNHLKQLQAHLITIGHGDTHFYAFKLIRLCTLRLCNLAYARRVFDKFRSPNIYLYTAIIGAYTRVPDHESAVLLYRDMLRSSRSKPNHYMFSIILKSWPEVVESYGVELVHTQIVKSGFGGNPVVQTAVLDGYSRYGADVGLGRKVFDEMPVRNVVSWTAMISAYARAGLLGNAVLLFEEMSVEIRDTPFWNCIIAGCLQNGLFTEAIEFFRRMIEEGVRRGDRPNQGTIVCALSALGHSGMLQLGKCIHGYVYRSGLSLDPFIVNGLIDMYGKCGSFGKSRIVFDKSPEINLTSWNSLINCYALHGRSHEAIGIFEDMTLCEDKVKPDGVTFVGLLNACTHGGLVVVGRHYYDMMIVKYGIEPQIEHYGCLIDLLCRSGRFEEAIEVVNGMRIPPDEIIWGSVLNGCKIHRRIDLAEFAEKKLIEMNPDNGGYRAMLANLYVEMGKWDESQKVRKMIYDGNVYKASGRSWIEVENQVHSFHSVDKSHPRTEEIYAVLGCLIDTSKMQYS